MTDKLLLGPVPKQSFVRLYITLPETLKADLERYATLHADTWGSSIDVATLIPHMLKTFIDRDQAFKRAAKRVLPST